MSSHGANPTATHSDGNADPTGGIGNVSGPERETAQVSHDMEGIFGGTAAAASKGDSSLKSDRVVPVVACSSDRWRKHPPARWVLALAGVVIAGSLVVSVGLTQHGTLSLSSSNIAKLLAERSSQLPEVHRVLDPVQTQAIRAIPKSIASEDITKTSTAAESSPKLILASEGRKHGLIDRVAKEPFKRAARSRAGGSCDRLGRLERAWCMRPQLVAADRQLRQAYHGAARAGVDRRVLVSYRNQWSRMRGRAISDPGRVALGFREIAQQLDAARRDRRADGR